MLTIGPAYVASNYRLRTEGHIPIYVSALRLHSNIHRFLDAPIKEIDSELYCAFFDKYLKDFNFNLALDDTNLDRSEFKRSVQGCVGNFVTGRTTIFCLKKAIFNKGVLCVRVKEALRQ